MMPSFKLFYFYGTGCQKLFILASFIFSFIVLLTWLTRLGKWLADFPSALKNPLRLASMVSRFLEPGMSKGMDALQRQAAGYQQKQTSVNNLGLVVPIEGLILR